MVTIDCSKSLMLSSVEEKTPGARPADSRVWDQYQDPVSSAGASYKNARRQLLEAAISSLSLMGRGTATLGAVECK